MVMWAICCLCDDELVDLKFEFCLVRVGDCGGCDLTVIGVGFF